MDLYCSKVALAPLCPNPRLVAFHQASGLESKPVADSVLFLRDKRWEEVRRRRGGHCKAPLRVDKS